MQALRQRLHKKVYRTFLRSFLLVFVLPAAALIIFMTHMLGTVEQELKTANRLMLEQFKSAADGQFYAIQRTGDTLMVDDKVLYFSYLNDPMQYLNNITAFQTLKSLMQEIATIQISSASVDSCYLYLSRNKKVISNTVMDGQDYYNRRLSGAFASQADWQDYLARGYNGFVRREPGEKGHPLSYVRTVLRGESPAMTIVITVGEQMFQAYQPLIQEREGVGFAILGPKGERLYSSKEGLALPGLEDVFPGEDGVQTADTPEGKFRLSWSRSADTGCIYVMTMPESIYWTPMETIRLVSIAAVALILAAGFFLSFALAKRQYRPILALRSFVEGAPAGENQETGDDYTYLLEMMKRMKNSRITINQQLKLSNRNMEHFVLESLLWGTYRSIKDVEEQLLALDITFDSEDFVVVGFCIDGFQNSDVTPGQWEEDARLMRFVLGNVFAELLAAYNARTVELYGWVYALLCMPPHWEAWQEKLAETLAHGQTILQENFDFHLTIAASAQVQGLHRVRQAYAWARDALAKRKEGANELLLSWQEPDRDQPLERLALEVENIARLLEKHVTAGDEEAALGEVASLKKLCAKMPGWMIRMQCGAVLQSLLQSFSLHFSQESALKLQSMIQQFVESPLGQDDFLELSRVVREACRLSSPGEELPRSADIAQRAMAYIQEHYAVSSMSIGEVAEKLGLTASYASALYKKHTGESMLDTINRTRLHHAKLLLSGSHMSLEQIAAQVGYYNSSSFIRTFKKYEGKTPGQYRASKADREQMKTMGG